VQVYAALLEVRVQRKGALQPAPEGMLALVGSKQQRCPLPPQATQRSGKVLPPALETQRLPGAAHWRYPESSEMLEMQQAWPIPPQVVLPIAQLPAVALHVGPVASLAHTSQTAPSPMQMGSPAPKWLMQQPPVQTLPGQHGLKLEAGPGVPHF
jgi:hypothetical protein